MPEPEAELGKYVLVLRFLLVITIQMLTQNQTFARQICKYWPEYHSSAFGNLWVFGPHYRVKELDFRCNAKKDALDFVLEKSGCTLPRLLTTLEDIEEEARSTYADDTLNDLQRVKFLEMMAMDGCFFLLLAFSILGVGSTGTEVGFPEKHLVFGIGCVREEIDLWIRSMFFVGNQIPLIVLEEIMKLRFFQELKTEKQWNQPLDFVKRALYNLLIAEHQPKSIDLIHCLQSTFLGRKSGLHVTVPIMDTDASDAIEGIPSATDLFNLGVKFEKLEGELGIRGIHYTYSAFNHVLYLPVFKVDRYTELIVKCLYKYEIVQASRGIVPDVSPYFKVFSELLRTPKDVELLTSQGVIQGQLEGLRRLLSSYDGMEPSEHVRHVRREIRKHPPPDWQMCIKFLLKLIALIAAILTLIFCFPASSSLLGCNK
ncbi:uncharacterized protein [Coffea arabica]|uniref:Uncharacterized protein n=1 Tax=Coffea arabica TaxID=13443 RepID=A0A6P6WQX1_COFAR|nr:uncharacterized protein LOC113735018 [Coffea arabica]